MAVRHGAQTTRDPLSISGSAGRVASLPTLGAFPARARRGSPSSETPFAADSNYLCSSDSLQEADANIRELVKQRGGYHLTWTNTRRLSRISCSRFTVSERCSMRRLL